MQLTDFEERCELRSEGGGGKREEGFLKVVEKKGRHLLLSANGLVA